MAFVVIILIKQWLNGAIIFDKEELLKIRHDQETPSFAELCDCFRQFEITQKTTLENFK